jgi:predicted GTPase
VQIAAFGMVGRGKSSVLNALLGQNVFQPARYMVLLVIVKKPTGS